MISWGEIVVVFFIALLLFGADKIPDLPEQRVR
jgi:Sec-independent protein translocase protein TatA